MNVALNLKERAAVKDIADARTEANAHRNDIPDYDKTRFNLSSKQANRLGVFAEALAFKWAGGNVLNHSLEDWASFVPNNHPDRTRLLANADLFNTIEVRRANSLHSPIPVRQKDRDLGAIVVQVYVPYKQPMKTALEPFPGITVGLHGRILGWCNADDEGTKPAWAKQAGSLVVERRSLDTLNLKEVLG